jgi:RNA polymerase sigma-70 factor, ECF subfamily
VGEVIVEPFDQFFAEEYPRVVAALSVAFRDRALAEEASQEAFVRALRRWKTVSAADRPAAWVYVVAVRVASRQRRRDRVPPAPPLRDDVADATQRIADAAWLRDALARLTARQREAVVLRYLADLQVRDVARAMRCREGTVKSTLHTALAALRVTAEVERS